MGWDFSVRSNHHRKKQQHNHNQPWKEKGWQKALIIPSHPIPLSHHHQSSRKFLFARKDRHTQKLMRACVAAVDNLLLPPTIVKHLLAHQNHPQNRFWWRAFVRRPLDDGEQPDGRLSSGKLVAPWAKYLGL